MPRDDLLSIMSFGCEETMDLQESKCTYIESVINKDKCLYRRITKDVVLLKLFGYL